MKSIRKFLFSALCATFAMVAFSQCAPAVEDLTLAIPFKCNAYVTPLDPASKITPSFANSIIANGYSLPNDAEMVAGAWLPEYQQQEPHQISVFFYTAYSGELHFGLRAEDVPAGVAELKVKCCGKEFDLEVSDADASKDYYVGKVNVAAPGHIRVDIEPVTTTAASYPTFSTLLATGAAVNNLTQKTKDEVVFVSAEDLKEHVPHFVRRGPSNHFNWHTPENTEYFYNEVFVPEGEDVSGAYYMLTGGDGFYMGIQPNEKGKSRMVLFSVWDTDTEKGLISELVRNGEGVKTNSYSHEGSGVQNFFKYDWEAGRTYATLVRVRPEYKNGKATGHSLYTGYSSPRFAVQASRLTTRVLIHSARTSAQSAVGCHAACSSHHSGCATRMATGLSCRRASSLATALATRACAVTTQVVLPRMATSTCATSVTSTST